GGIAHDFNNILAPIFGYTELALGDVPPDSKTALFLKEVLTSGKRAKELVHQILTFSRKTEHAMKPLLIQPIVKEVLKLMRSSIPTTIDIQQNIDMECGPVNADPIQIHQLVMNLCTNAFQAMPNTSGVLRVTLKSATLHGNEPDFSELTPGDYLLIMISDTGKGMDADLLSRIFEPYFTTKSQGEGTGLGLSVAHGIVRNHGGQITVHSDPGIGTTFHIYLPMLKSLVPPDAKLFETPVIPGVGSEHILFVDDEIALVQAYEQILTKLNYQVSVFSDPVQALNAFHEQPDEYDLVITDQTMPHLQGSELAQEILTIRPDIPVILCTGYSSHFSEEKALDIGISEYLMKPLEKRTLAESIRRLLDDHKKHTL
ncbi:ATP-binding protein, partial [Thermodesulfobacteriota bacterium]